MARDRTARNASGGGSDVGIAVPRNFRSFLILDLSICRSKASRPSTTNTKQIDNDISTNPNGSTMAESGLHEDTVFPPLHAGSLSIAINKNFLAGVTNER